MVNLQYWGPLDTPSKLSYGSAPMCHIMITFRSRSSFRVCLTIITKLFAGQIAVFSSFEKDDLHIEEYPSWQETKE